MMKQYFTDLEVGLQEAIRGGNSSPKKLYTLELARLGKRLYSGTDAIAWCGITAPFDLLNAMGVTSCFVEFIGAMLASTGLVGSFIEETDHTGYSSDACSYHRSVSGAAIKDMMPVPEFLIGTTNPCSGGLAVMENLAHHFKKNSSSCTYRRMIRKRTLNFSPTRCGGWLHSRHGSPAGNWMTMCSGKP
jgi:hypothetical protein